MQVIINGELLEEVDCFKYLRSQLETIRPLAVDCFKYLRSQVAADGECERDVVHRMNEGYRVWRELKSVLSNRGSLIKAKKCLYKGV